LQFPMVLTVGKTVFPDVVFGKVVEEDREEP
jgi:hypothetical protein